MFVVFYTVNLYICDLWLVSHPTVFYDTVMDPWNVCMIHHSGETSDNYQCSEERPPDGGGISQSFLCIWPFHRLVSEI